MGARKKKIAGVIGGMGPEATVDLLSRIIKFTEAADDCDHARCLVDQNPHVPSRIRYLLENGDVSPGPCLAEMAKNLVKAGADFLCIPCNTAHNWYGEVANAVSVPVLNIIVLASQAAAGRLKKEGSGKNKVGVLASPAVRITGLYDSPCQQAGLTPIYADDEHERKLLAIIRAIKGGDSGPETLAKYEEVIRHFEQKGADALIVACTELGTIPARTNLPVIDAADSLAREVVRMSGAKLKNLA